MIYKYQQNDIMISPFSKDWFSQNFAIAKFRKNKTLAKISGFTVSGKYTCHTYYIKNVQPH